MYWFNNYLPELFTQLELRTGSYRNYRLDTCWFVCWNLGWSDCLEELEKI